jgi:hypothetical protein
MDALAARHDQRSDFCMTLRVGLRVQMERDIARLG